jgi:hypothetical protein
MWTHIRTLFGGDPEELVLLIHRDRKRQHKMERRDTDLLNGKSCDLSNRFWKDCPDTTGSFQDISRVHTCCQSLSVKDPLLTQILHCLSVKTLTGLWGEESEGLTQNPLNSNSATDNVNFFFFLPTMKLREVSDTEVRRKEESQEIVPPPVLLIYVCPHKPV